MAQKTSILRVLMPMVSLLILCYYVISFPLSFDGDGGPSNAQASLGKPFNNEDLKNNELGAGKNAVLSKREEDFVDIVNNSTEIANNVESDDEMGDNGHKFRDPVMESEENLQFDSQKTEEPALGDFPDGSFLGEDLFHSPDIFRRNYKEMEDKFKIYIYPDGDPNTFYQTPRKLTGKYASEGYFFQNLPESKFYTTNADEAHLFFIPISCHKMRGKGTSYEKMTQIVEEYVGILKTKYPYWNRTLGADHFFVTCHDVGARATEKVLHLVKNSIRVVCSPSYNGDFIPHKDVSMPQILQPFALPRGGNDTSNRTVLGFWAGHRNSRIRVVLAKLWENDTVLAISNNRINRALGELVYQKQYYKTKFCICPGGSQVNSARIADSIHYGCIPGTLDEQLRWTSKP